MTGSTPAQSAETGIVLMPHTHWDREWYEPFQVFRFRLVEMFDEVVDRAEADRDFRFTLDGQTAAIEDYLAMRPENAGRVQRLVERGQLALGPWQILLDEFLCSGETIVRNLEMGWNGAEALGGAMRVGYLPDMFGHVAQMPQILARAGIDHASLWRGVPGSVEGHSFSWTSPDGSAVRVEYLFDGYGSALDLLSVPEKIQENMARYREDTRGRYGDHPVLGMVGTDHMAPHPELMGWVRQNHSDEFPIRVETLEEYVGRYDPAAERELVHGELRSHARGNILPGVISIRRPLKQAMALAERTIGEAERVAAMWSATNFDGYYRMAWQRIIESTAHDSVVGSGTDETVRQVHSRLEEAAQIARVVRDSVLGEQAGRVPNDAFLVVNTLPSDRTVMVELDVPAPDATAAVSATAADGTALAVQEVGFAPTALGDEFLDSTEFSRLIRRIHGRELFGQQIDGYHFDGNTLEIHVAEVPIAPVFDIAEFEEQLARAAERHPGPWHVKTTAQARRRVLVEVPVPPLGTAAFRVGSSEVAPDDGGLVVSARRMSNGLVSVDMHDDGTFTLTGVDGSVLAGVGTIVDGGDRGDSYNYGPPSRDVLVDRPREVLIEVVESGPLRAVTKVSRVYDWPVALSSDVDARTAETVPTLVEALVELRRDEPFVRMRLTFTNHSSDHRVRLHIPLPEPVSSSASEGQFSVTTRGLTGEGGWGEFPIPTYPAYGFASAGPATVLVRHATEYEVVGEQDLAITLGRMVGSISVNVHPLRDEPAASVIPIPGGQELGTPFTADLAIMSHSGGWAGAGAVAWAEHFKAEPLVTRGTADLAQALQAPRSGLSLDGDDVVLSSLRMVGDHQEVRLVGMSAEPTVALLRGNFTRAARTDLLGRGSLGEPCAGELQVELGPWEIRTIRLGRD
jgi:mannosylglycerate hydrolase